MPGHKHKTAAELAWLENRDAARLVVRNIMRRLENEVLTELDRQFKAKLATGELSHMKLQRGAVAALVQKHAGAVKGV